MFTGIVEEVGTVQKIERYGETARIEISAEIVNKDTREGDSIAVSGVCLTAVQVNPDSFIADVSKETSDKTTLGRISVGAKVNLERALTLQTRLGGHLILGHVDACGKIVELESAGDYSTIKISYPPEFSQYLVYKGSIAVEGISLTIARLTDEWFEVAIIPKTWAQTNLSYLKPLDSVNLEFDILAKYVERILAVKRM